MEHPAVLAFDVGGTTIKAEILPVDDATVGPVDTPTPPQPWTRATAPTPRGPALVTALAELCSRMLADLDPERRSRVSGVGVALPGIVDTAAGVSVFAANVGLRDVPISAPLADVLGLPVWLGHDVTVAADAERSLGAAAGVQDPVVVVIGTGIAAVSYVHGRRVQGVSGQAGELGHVVVRPGGPRCGCGADGCLEAVASAAAVARGYAEATGAPVTGAADVVQRLHRDPAADAVWAEATTALAEGLLIVAALLAPGAIVLGGGLAEAGDELLAPVAARMRERARAVTVPELRVAALGSRAGVVGAALLGRSASARVAGGAR